MPACRRVACCAVAGVVLVLASCGGRESGSAAARAGESASTAADTAAGQGPVAAPDLVTSAAPVISPEWPKGWKLVETSRSGPDASPIVWFQLEAPERHPDDAVRMTLDALGPLAGTPVDDDVALSVSRTEAIGQLRGPRMSAAVVARATQTGTEIEIALELSR